jgi:hypothetical protein
MKIDLLVRIVLVVAAICLVKLAFFPDDRSDGLIRSAHAEGSLIEWKNSTRIVSLGNDGATTYVWDYEGKTKVRKYAIVGDSLTLKTYYLESK